MFIFSQFWSLKIQDGGTNGVTDVSSLLGVQMTDFMLWPRMTKKERDRESEQMSTLWSLVSLLRGRSPVRLEPHPYDLI